LFEPLLWYILKYIGGATTMIPKKRRRIRTYKLPLEQGALDNVLNLPGVYIQDKKVFQDKSGDITVYLEYIEEVSAEGGQELW